MVSSVHHEQLLMDDFRRNVVTFYETKKKFEDGINQILERKKARGQVLDKTQRKQIRVGTCTACGKPGMTFSSTKDELRIECNTNPNCKVNQVIRRPVFENIELRMNDAKRDVDVIKEEIIHLKLNLLFGYASNEDTLSAFSKLQTRMKKAFNAYDQLRMQYYDIVSNNDKLKQLQDVNDAISKAINEIKTNLSSSEAVQVTDSVVQATVHVYTDRLLNLLELQEKLKYSMSEVIPDEDEGYGNDRSVWRKRVNRVPLSPSDFIIPFRISHESHSD
jgi:ssDNA-binding Zn-finger/Zn-ribbon topoisomerase 1